MNNSSKRQVVESPRGTTQIFFFSDECRYMTERFRRRRRKELAANSTTLGLTAYYYEERKLRRTLACLDPRESRLLPGFVWPRAPTAPPTERHTTARSSGARPRDTADLKVSATAKKSRCNVMGHMHHSALSLETFSCG